MNLHEKALGLAKQMKRLEGDLLSVIQKIDESKHFRHYGCTSLFRYCTERLELSDSVSYALISVTRKSVHVPSLRKAMESGSITLSQAKRITSVITEQNARQWISLALGLPQKLLEKEVARANPKAAVRERAKYVSADRLELTLGVSEQLMEKLKRAQDLQGKGLEETLETVVDFYLERKRPYQEGQTQCR